MKKQILTMFTGLFIGAIITGGASAYAAGILAERSSHRIFVDGQEVQMEAYGIAGHNYVKLRDIGKAVGFNVFWDADSGCVQIETGAPSPARLLPLKLFRLLLRLLMWMLQSRIL